MDLGLKDKVAVVTAASKGIGLAIVRALVAEGALVVAGARSVEGLAGVPGVTAVAVDLARPDGPATLVARALEEHRRVDVLVNNMGGGRLRLDGFLAVSDDEFRWAFEINFSALRAIRAAVKPMLEQGRGAIVNVASVNARFQPEGGTIDCGAAKAPSSTWPSRCRRSSGRAASASTPCRPARSPPTVARRQGGRAGRGAAPGPRPRRRATRSSPASAGWRPGG